MRLTKIVPFLVFLASIFSFHEAKSQFNRFGIRAGVLSTDWINKSLDENPVNYTSKTGFFIGFYSVKEFQSNYHLEYGLNLSLQGFGLDGQLIYPGVMIGGELKNHSVYLAVPVAMRMVFGDNSPSGFFVKAGLQPAYLVVNQIEGSITYNGTRYYGDPESNADELNRFDLAIFPGVGYQLENGLNIELIYEYGLINPVKDDNYLGIQSANNSVLKLSLALDL